MCEFSKLDRWDIFKTLVDHLASLSASRESYEVVMLKKPKDEMLPSVTGVQTDFDDKDNPTVCLVGLLTEEGVKSFTLNDAGARIMVMALQTFLDRVDNGGSTPAPEGRLN